jgi:pantoate kinase
MKIRIVLFSANFLATQNLEALIRHPTLDRIVKNSSLASVYLTALLSDYIKWEKLKVWRIAEKTQTKIELQMYCRIVKCINRNQIYGRN